MNFPGYISIYKDNEGYLNLYFYKGIYNNKPIYQNINEDLLSNFDKKINEDQSIIYKIKNKNVKNITVILISNQKNFKNYKFIYKNH